MHLPNPSADSSRDAAATSDSRDTSRGKRMRSVKSNLARGTHLGSPAEDGGDVLPRDTTATRRRVGELDVVGSPPRRDPRELRSSVLDVAVERALRSAADCVETIPGAGWRVALLNGTHIEARARIAGEGWLELRTPGPQPVSLCTEALAWPLLCLNARLNGCARVACRPDGALEVRAELFIGTDEDEREDSNGRLGARAIALCDDVRAAHHDLCMVLAGQQPEPAPVRAGSVGEIERLVGLCDEAGWTTDRDGSGAVRVLIDGPSTVVHASVALSTDLRLQAAAPFVTKPLTSQASREAIALSLLRVAATVRAVKGTTLPAGDLWLPGVGSSAEAPLRSAADLDRALSALAVAYRLAGREVEALQDEALAREYLAWQYPRHAGSHERAIGREPTTI